MLNGPATILKNTAVKSSCLRNYNETGEFIFPGSKLMTIKECNRCCSCKYLRQKGILKANDKCDCTCRCYGYFKYDHWKFNYHNDLPNFENGSIKILYRDKIKVFYNTVSEADADGYREYDPEQFHSKKGLLYAFTGLRGDAKKLYRNVVKGKENRVRLIHSSVPED